MPTGPVLVYGGVHPPQGVPISLIETELGLCVEGKNLTKDTLPLASILPPGTLAKTTDNGLMRTKKDKKGELVWYKIEL